jgi:hypothetical protein
LYSQHEIERFLAQDAAAVVAGRALYPRFYRAQEGEPGSGWWAFRERDFARLGFFVIGPERANVILPLETSPDWFPNASDVIVVGCQEEDYIEAASIWVSIDSGSKEDLLMHPSFEELTCPLSPP